MSEIFLSKPSLKVWPSGPEAEKAAPRLNRFANLYMSAKLPAWYMHLMLNVRQIGLDKGETWIDNNTDYLFIGIGETLRRLFWNGAFSTHGDFFRKILNHTISRWEPQQAVNLLCLARPSSCSSTQTTASSWVISRTCLAQPSGKRV